MNATTTPHAEHYQRIRENPRFIALVQARSRLTWRLSVLVLCSYFIFMGVAACLPELLRIPLHQDSHLPLGIPVAIMLILVAWLLTGWYVYRANTYFDSLSASIVGECQE
ncbi:DUF485 domain-containing protein [Pseudomonas aeruginosa]|nr:DUF485 domain-containing protein [Pseudomonas aeruginosa]